MLNVCFISLCLYQFIYQLTLSFKTYFWIKWNEQVISFNNHNWTFNNISHLRLSWNLTLDKYLFINKLVFFHLCWHPYKVIKGHTWRLLINTSNAILFITIFHNSTYRLENSRLIQLIVNHDENPRSWNIVLFISNFH